MHINLIVTSWSVLCRMHTIGNKEEELGKFPYHVLPDNKKGIEGTLNMKEFPYFCVGDSPVPMKNCIWFSRMIRGFCAV